MHDVGLLATLPDPGFYLDPVKIGTVFVLFGVWLFLCQWANHDARLVNTHQSLWNGVVFAAGTVSLALCLLIPQFIVGVIILVLVGGGGVIAYVVHRNSLVVDQAKVCTMSHIQRLMAGRRGSSADDVEEKVRLTDWDGHHVPVPEDMLEREQFKAVQNLLHDVLYRRASDVDIVPAGHEAKVAYRIDGVATPRDPMPAPAAEQFTRYLKKLAGLDADDHRRPQSGQVTATRGDEKQQFGDMVKIEIKTSGSTAGERLMIRVLAEESRFKIADLGMTEQQTGIFEKIVQAERGVVLCCGPQQSGLTSTLYAILRSHDAFMNNIHTLEHQFAMELENITQNRFDRREAEATYARKFQTVLRADPNLVMIDALPDASTAQLAAEAGASRNVKIYIGTADHDCMRALQRWIKLVGDAKAAAAPLLAITAQRLVRRLCPECRQAYKPDPAILKKANIPAGQVQQFFRPGGYLLNKKGEQILCETCQGTGYFGRTAVLEVLPIHSEVRKMIASAVPINQIKAACRKAKPPMLYLQEQGIRRVIEGITSINEIIRVTREEPTKSRGAS